MRFHTAVNKFCWQAVMGTPLTVWRTALDQKRPYLDLEDAVEAVRFFLRRDLFDGRIYNVVTQNLTVREIVDAIREHVPSVAVELVDAAIMNQLSYDVSAARLASAGFSPRGDVRRAIADTIGRLRGANADRVVETATPKDRPAGTMYTREQFEALRAAWARELAADRALVRDARDLLGRADRHNWVHQGSWFGEPLLNLPQDVVALQDIIWRTRPRRIVEVGVAWGGSLLFYAGLFEALGMDDAEIIGVDVYVPDDLRARIAAHERLARRIKWVVGSSTAPETLAEVQRLVGDHRDVLVVLDSDHTHAHVLAELRAYAPLVGAGHYMVCCDTIVEDLPTQAHRPRPWGPGNNPATALRAFLAEQTRFALDEAVDDRLLLTCNPGGWLRAGADS
jgi:cephalosporin hydroxylase